MLAAVLLSVASSAARAQELVGVSPLARAVIVPQRHAYAVGAGVTQVGMEGVQAKVLVQDRLATTTLVVSLFNPGASDQPAELLVPVPAGAVVRAFAFDGGGQIGDTGAGARLLERDVARTIYEDIVRQLQDPALLEFAGHAFIRSEVFPVPAGGRLRVLLTYEQLLKADGDRLDYVLPRSEVPAAAWMPWKVQVVLKQSAAISAVWSPTHEVEQTRWQPDLVQLEIGRVEAAEPGPFRLSWMAPTADLGASFLAYPDRAVGGGYMTLLAGMPETLLADGDDVPRDVTVVLDRSGSMRGAKLAQAKEAALQVLEGLSYKDAFNLVSYADTVTPLWAGPRTKTDASMAEARTELGRITSHGGTNLHGALLESLRQPARREALPVVLFLTDGLPTVGITDEATIRQDAARSNDARRRVFTFGVGHDVNAPLLDHVADASRGRSTFVAPDEDVEVAVGATFRRLTGPVLVAPELQWLDAAGKPVTDRVRDMEPASLGDLFAGDELMVCATYTGDEPLRARLSGSLGGQERSFEWVFQPSRASRDHSFVPRLWASRRIGSLVDRIRQEGSTSGKSGDAPWVAEAVAEIVALSTEFGVLTEYTSFLAREGVDLDRLDDLRSQTRMQLAQRAQNARSGAQAVTRAVDIRRQRESRRVRRDNGNETAGEARGYLAQLVANPEPRVRRVHDLTFFLRDDRWVDTRVLRRTHAGEEGAEDLGEPERREVDFGSDEYFALAQQLAAHGRQGVMTLDGAFEVLLEDEDVLVLVRT